MSALRALMRGIDSQLCYNRWSKLSRFRLSLGNDYCHDFGNMCLRNSSSLTGAILVNLSSVSPLIALDQQRSYAKRVGTKAKKGKGPKYEMSDEELSQLIPVDEMEAFFLSNFTKLKTDYSVKLSLRTGLGIENISVELEENVFPIKDLAQISKKSSNLVVLNLSSLPDALKPVLNAINSSGMNLSPQVDGTKIFLTLPKVTKEHREGLAKSAKNMFNATKQEINEIANRYIDQTRLPKSGVSQEIVKNAGENIRFRAQEMIQKCEDLLRAKTKELLDD